MRLSTVLAACAPSGIAAWQLIRSGWPDGAAAVTRGHDARIVDAGQRFVGEQPAQRVGAQPAARGQVRHAEAGRPHRHRAGQDRAVGQHHRVRSRTSADHARPRARRRRAWPAAWPLTAAAAGSATGPARPPQTSVTRRPCSASSEAVSMPVRPRADHGDGCVRVQLVQGVAQPLGLLEIRDGIGEFAPRLAPWPAPRRCCRRRRSGSRSSARHRRSARPCAVGGVDPVGAVDDQPDPLAEQCAVVDGGGCRCRRPTGATGFARRRPDGG